MEFIIQTNNLVKAYKEQIAVDHVNLHIRKGSIYGLLGRNGAGKTTIMKMILGLTNATSGDISIMGKSLKNYESELYARIGVMLDTLSFYPNLTATENLNVFAKHRGTISRNAVRDALEIAGLPFADKKQFSEFSLGMKQRLGFANAIMHDPELLILDEPSNGLDPVGIVEMRKYIKMLCEERGKTILISSHILSEIALLADDIGILHHGKLLEECSYTDLQSRNRQYIQLQEALVRWVSDDGTLISPIQFIGLFEKSGQIQHLDFYMLEQVCLFLKSLITQGISVLPIAVNFSRVHLYSDEFVNKVNQMVERYDLEKHLIEIECTETTMLNNIDLTRVCLGRLQEQGFSIAMDDFGSAYSSLNTLSSIPLDILKLDRGFLMGTLSHEKANAKIIIRSVINLAHDLSLKVVAEGVETEEQYQFLKSLGCDFIQGYYFSKPLDEAHFLELLS